MLRQIIMFCMLGLTSFTQAAIIEGNLNGQVTLIDVYDYQCLYCHRMFHVIKQVMEVSPQLKVRFMPVAVLNQTSLIEAAAAIAATAYPGEFDSLNTALLNDSVIDKTKLRTILQSLSSDSTAFNQAMHDITVQSQLNEGLTLLAAYHSEGVPLIVIYSTSHPEIKRIFQGEQSQETLLQAISEVNYANKM